MTKRPARRLLPFAVIVLLFLSGCAARAGRVYHIEKETIEARFAAGPPARLDMHANWKLRNAGGQPLASLEVELPNVPAGGRENLIARVNGREVAPRGAADLRADRIGVPFVPRWAPKQSRALDIKFQLALQQLFLPRASPQPNLTAFDLEAGHWFPSLQRPAGLFARGRERAREMQVTILVPQGFRVLSGGRPLGSRQRGAEVECRFLLRGRDPEPFLVVGRYLETAFPASSNAIVFWTLEPLTPADAQSAAARLADTLNAYQRTFGEPLGTARPFYIVESGRPADASPLGAARPYGVSFPGGVLVNHQAIALGVTSESFLKLVEKQLAATWFEQIIHPRREASLVLGEGATSYATIVAAEAREGEAARRVRAALLLREYEGARGKAVEKPLASVERTEPAEQLEIARAKAPLFFLALEDRCTKESVRRALAHLVRSLRGQEVGFADLRSALEEECHADLGEFFRIWLNQTGIPADFRSRYASNSSTP